MTHLFLNSGPTNAGTYHARGQNAATPPESELISPILIYLLIYFIYWYAYLFNCVSGGHIPQWVCGSQRTPCWTQFSPSIPWVSEIELRSPDLEVSSPSELPRCRYTMQKTHEPSILLSLHPPQTPPAALIPHHHTDTIHNRKEDRGKKSMILTQWCNFHDTH